MWLSSFPNTTCWRDCASPIIHSCLLCHKLIGHICVSKCFPCALLSVCMCLCMCVCVVWMISYIYYLYLNMNVLVIANILFQQHKRQFYTWISPNGQCWNQIHYILWSRRRRSSIQSAKTRWELTVAEIMNSLLLNSDLNKTK